MTYMRKGRYVSIDVDAPDALGICDKSGFVFNKRDLIKQMEWRGNSLQWTGFLVGRPFLDTPNEQARPPILPPDPLPVIYPRLPQPLIDTWGNNAFNAPGKTFNQIFGITFCQALSQIYTTGVQALPDSQRLAALENFNWSQH